MGVANVNSASTLSRRYKRRNHGERWDVCVIGSQITERGVDNAGLAGSELGATKALHMSINPITCSTVPAPHIILAPARFYNAEVSFQLMRY